MERILGGEIGTEQTEMDNQVQSGDTSLPAWGENLRRYYQNGLDNGSDTRSDPTPLYGHKGHSMIHRPTPFFVSGRSVRGPSPRMGNTGGASGHSACRGQEDKPDQKTPEQIKAPRKQEMLGWTLYPAESSQET